MFVEEVGRHHHPAIEIADVAAARIGKLEGGAVLLLKRDHERDRQRDGGKIRQAPSSIACERVDRHVARITRAGSTRVPTYRGAPRRNVSKSVPRL